MLADSLARTSAGSKAALTAPQPSCPITTTRCVFKCSTAYSILPVVPVSTTFPATRVINKRPNPDRKRFQSAHGCRNSREQRQTAFVQKSERGVRRLKVRDGRLTAEKSGVSGLQSAQCFLRSVATGSRSLAISSIVAPRLTASAIL